MRPLAPVALLLLLAAAVAPALGQAPPGAGVQYAIVLDCPRVQGLALSVDPTSPTAPGGCPVRAVDGQDQMGDPSLAVDPFEPENLILASLHGRGDGGGPTIRSRGGQVFTTFTSTDSGASWFDNPFTPPEDMGFDAYGQHPQVTIDPYGHVYVGSLYAVRHGDGEGGGDGSGGRFDYVVAAQKFASLETINEEQDGEYHAQYLDPVFRGNAIGQLWFLFNPGTDNMTMVWHEQVTPHSTAAGPEDGRTGKGAWSPPGADEDEDDDGAKAPAAVPRQAPRALPFGKVALPPPAQPTAKAAAEPEPAPPALRSPRSVIGVAWTGQRASDPYHYQEPDRIIGPCSASTNPVLSEGWLYVGCVARTDEGPFPWNPAAAKGTVEMFRLHPDGGEPHYLGPAPVSGDGASPKLGVRSDGRLALLSARAADGRLALRAAFGAYDPGSGRVEWSPPSSHGADLADADPSLRVAGANVQDVIYREHSGVLHFVLKEAVEPQGVAVTSLQGVYMPHIRKSVVALDERHGVLARLDLDLGNLANRTDPELLNAPEAVYDDLSDDFLQLPMGPFSYQGKDLGPAYQREFIAVADYGTVLFAEVVELTNLRGPAAVPAIAPAPALAAPASSLSASSVLLPVAGLAITALMAAAFAVHRRKDPLAALAKGGKK